MRIKHIDPIELTILQRAILFPIFFLSIAFLVFSFSPTDAWAAAPPTPTNLTATAASSRQINLSWTDNATTETNYYVERSPNGSSSWTVIATLGANVTSYQNTGLSQNTTYYYRVRCKAGSTYSSYSNTAHAMTATLAAPTALTTAVASASQITVTWTDNTAYETQYSIERSPNGSSSWTVIGTVATNVTTTINSGLTAGTAYYYRVRAYDSTNYSAYSNTANETIRTITASAGANGTIAPSGTIGVANGTSKAFTMTPNTGYTISTVTVDGGAVATNPTYTFSNIIVNHTIAATFSAVTYTITASAGTNGTISPTGAYSVSSGGTATFTITPAANYHVADVVVDGASKGLISSFTFTNVIANHTIAASFVINTFTVTPSVTGGSGTINPTTPQIVSYGSNTAFTITPNTGYYLSNLSVDGSSVATASTYTFTNVTANHTIAATFSAITYTITSSASANGTISPLGAVSVISGATQTFTTTPNTGYYLSNLSVDGSSVTTASTYTFTNVFANHTIAATFSAITYTITASAGANGTISPLGAVSVISGATQTFTVTPTAGYRVSDVQVDGSSIGAVSSYPFSNVISNHTITAIFSAACTTISGGTISVNTTWTLANSPYVVTGDVTIGSSSNPMLTIEAGVVVKFNNGTGLNIAGGWSIQGALNAVGTAAAPIIFTSNDPAPAPGKWKGITFNNGATTALLDHVTVEFGGSNGIGNLYSYSGSPTIRNSTIWKSSTYGIYAGNSYNAPTIQNSTIANNASHGIYVYSSATPTITGNTITNNGGYGIYDANGTATLISANTISGSGSFPARMGILQTGNVNTYGTNVINAVEVIGGTVGQNLTIRNLGLPYIITSDITVGSSSSPMLTIEAGATIKFNNGTGLNIANGWSIQGALNAVGTAVAPIIFTSNDPAPAPGKWKGITFNNGATTALLDHVTVEFGGSNGIGNLYSYSGSPTIRNSTIWKSSTYGIYAGNSYNAPTIQNSTIANNANHGIYVYSSATPTITGNTITNNGGYGIYDANGTATLISANTISGSGSYPARMGVLQTGNVNTYGTNGINAVEVIGGTVGQNLIIKNLGLPYIITSDITVGSSSSPILTIEAGATIKFNNGAGLNIANGWSVPAALSAAGTAVAPILFTSNDPAPAPGKWKGITFNNGTTTASLDYVTVEFGGSSGIGNLYIYSGSPTIRNSTIRRSSNYGINVASSYASPIIQNNAITNNGGYGIYDTSGTANLISGNTISGSGSYPARMGVLQTGNVNSYGMNGINAVEVIGGTIGQNLTMKNLSLPYIITSDITVGSSSNPMLTIEAGVTVKFNNGTGLYIANGTGSPGALKAVGTAALPIVVTSNEPAPAPGKWKGITFNIGTIGANTVLDYVTVKYGGQGGAYSNANLVINSSSPVIMNSTIRNSAGSGVYVTNASNSPVIVNSDISVNKWGVYSYSSNPFVQYNNIYANTTAGVWNATTSPDVDARNNWWGVATGPTYTAGNASGSGDSITDHVLYNPWLGQPTGSNLSITEARAMPSSLNPNGGQVTFTASLSSSATWTITISDGSSNTVNTFTGSGITIKQKWYGVDSQSIKVADGPYYYRIDAQDPISGAVASSPEGLLMVSSQIPIVYMDPPVDYQLFTDGTATINITGRVSDATDFKNYTLDYGVGGNPASWTTLTTANSQVLDSMIYTWNTSALTGDIYTLRLTVNDNAGNTVVDTARVRFLRIKNAAVSQNYISPNGDGRQDITTFSAAPSYPSAWTLTIKDSLGATVRTFSGTATSVAQDWSGTNDADAIVADGIYTYTITAVNTETGIQATPKTGNVTVDTTSPTALIAMPVSNSVVWSSVLITGNAIDTNFDTYKVEYGPSTGAGPWTLINSGTSPIINNTLATWNTALPSQLPNGNYLIRLAMTDKAGNSSISSVPVILDGLEFGNVSASTNYIDTLASQSSSIFFTINGPATVTLKMIPEKQGSTGTPIYQASQTCAAAGAYFFTWNGQDNTGKAAPDEAYIYILEATDGIKTTSYNPPAPTGTGTVICSQSTGFDPAKNLPMTVTYAPAQPSRVNINISWGGENFKILDAFPASPGNHTFDWDGRDLSNKLLNTGATSACSVASLLRENFIITTGDTVQVSEFKIDPYMMSLSYGNLTRIQYTLSRDVIVSVKITSPSGSIINLLTNQTQAAGSKTIEWNGLDATDPAGLKTLIVQEGDYMVSVQAVNPVTGTSSTARNNLRIRY